jgi:hypothetical protein
MGNATVLFGGREFDDVVKNVQSQYFGQYFLKIIGFYSLVLSA